MTLVLRQTHKHTDGQSRMTIVLRSKREKRPHRHTLKLYKIIERGDEWNIRLAAYVRLPHELSPCGQYGKGHIEKRGESIEGNQWVMVSFTSGKDFNQPFLTNIKFYE